MGNHYVDTAADAGGDGTTTALTGANCAWDTIADVNAHTFTGDDFIYLKRGCTWREQLTVGQSGTSGHPITYGAYGTGDKPKILGSTQITGWADQTGNIWKASCATEPTVVWFINTSDGKTKWGVNDLTPDAEYDWYWSASYLYCYAATDPDSRYLSVEAPIRDYGVSFSTRSYITVQNIEFAYTVKYAINSSNAAADYATIDSCAAHHAGPLGDASADGIRVGGSYTTVSNNLVYECGTHGIYVYSPTATGDDLTYVTIEGNEVYNCYHTKIDISSRTGAGLVDYISILRNYVYDTDDYTDDSLNAEGIKPHGVSGYKITNVTIAYNIVRYCHGCPILIYQYNDYVNLYNNTVYQLHIDGASAPMISIGATVNTNVTVKNNIAIQDDLSDAAFRVADSTSVAACDYNCWYNTGTGETRPYVTTVSPSASYHDADFVAYKSATGWDANGKWENPDLANPGGIAASDYQLSADSPCINAGVDVSLTEDYAGDVVPHLGAPSIGAYEWSGGGYLVSESVTIGLE